MGLPIWRNPGEDVKKPATKTDVTATARSTIRRRTSIHARQSTRPRLTRDGTLPRFEPRSPPPHARRVTDRGIPPIATLLESADRQHALPPPPPVPEPRSYNATDTPIGARERDLRDSIRSLRDRAGQLRRRNEVPRERQVPARSNRAPTEGPDRDVAPVSGSPGRPFSFSPADDRSSAARDHSRDTLPTPPADVSESNDSLFVPSDPPRRLSRGLHPLRHSWSPEALDGLGDRNRSPTPPDGWEIMRATITPDATLPSAESSFNSAAASQSFNRDSDSMAAAPGVASTTGSSSDGRRDTTSSEGANSDSDSSVDPNDLFCEDEEPMNTAVNYAEAMFDFEIGTVSGRARIRAQERIRAREGNRFALANESNRVDIGFRLIEEALESDAGRQRLLEIGVLDQPENLRNMQQRRSIRTGRFEENRIDRDLPLQIISAPASPPRRSMEHYSPATREAAREARDSVHEYFRQFTADALELQSHTRSPPPQYEPLSSHPDVSAFTSRDGPTPHPVSPPTQRSQTEVADAFFSGDETDLAAMRRVVERLARRDDVPDEWWSSIGLNLSRTRPRTERDRRGDWESGENRTNSHERRGLAAVRHGLSSGRMPSPAQPGHGPSRL
ncbi:hypothetical protein Tdes44962_MAKER08035 [Teratosphaeria destructans]|uniref:Uncharacterized protein n=1 Tax=Teratosphaeria destructans TaxID=418781 RepID=A0A9W7SXS2_9PEZI|nr:hypothetical protein Tdes44962_MAKER08035 [Teratosphaeria destructans]